MRNLKILAGGCALVLTASTLQAQTPAFSNQSGPSGIGFVHNTGGFSNWDYTGGGAAGDFNSDGWVDLFAVSGGSGGVPDKLFINQQDGTLADEAAAWGTAVVHLGKAAGVGDVNRDGELDIMVTSAGAVGSGGQAGQHKLWMNNGNETMTNSAGAWGVNFTTGGSGDGFGPAFGDYDLDGDLDLFIAGFASGNNGSRLFRNNLIGSGASNFTDVTGAINLWGGVSQAFAFAPWFSDMDGDNYPELAIACDFGTMKYFANDGDGTFTEVTLPAGLDDAENGMGGVVRDFDGDLDRDWYVTSIYLPQINWTGNKLHINNSTPGFHSFSEIGAAVGVDDGGYGWGTVGVDFNHDTRMDIAETNGDSSGGGTFFNEPSYLWIKTAGGSYSELSALAGLNHSGKGRGMIDFDYDNDGDMDVVIFANDEPVTVWRNDIIDLTSGPQGANVNWLKVYLDTSGTSLAPNGFGSEVIITVGGDSYMRNIDGGQNFLSMSELVGHFGLGTATVVDEVKVTWNDGTETVLTNVAANQAITVSAAGGDPTWQDLGLGKAGVSGVPVLVGTGPLTSGSNNSVDLTNAAPSSTTTLVVGLNNLSAPFKGGTLVPSPDILVSGLPTDVTGAISLPFVWPAILPADTELYWQHWVSDGTASAGLSASNALLSTSN